jgi:cell division septum initiation protein DivIVA
MSLIINNKQLLDSIESLEKRINKHTEILSKLEKLIKECTGSRISEGVSQTLQETIKEIYK